MRYGLSGGAQLAADGGVALALTVDHLCTAAASLSWALWEKIKYEPQPLTALATDTIAFLSSITLA